LDPEIVIDASSALAFLLREPGWRNAPQYFARGIMLSVNYAEVVQRARRYGGNGDLCEPALRGQGLAFVDADMATAHAAGELEAVTRGRGVSLADRFCLAFAMQRNCPVLTTDRPWKELGLPVDLRMLR
jgi:ribonuclease VapC